MTGNKAIKAVISGRVQGVFYRAETKKAADRLGVNGWVRNLPNGCVEAVFQADDQTIDQMLAWCRRGSPGAVVSGIVTESCPVPEDFDSFNIRYG